MKSVVNYFLIALILICLSTFLLHCEKEVVKVRDDEDIPVLETEPGVLETSGTSATIYWITDEPCSVNVYYGLTTFIDTLTKTGTEFRQVHTIILTELIPNSDYFYLTSSYDVAGNFTQSTPGTFSTPDDTINFIIHGWDAFENGEFAVAGQLFFNYLLSSPEHTEALTGYGWSLTRIDSFANAINQFSLAIEFDDQYTDAFSGLSMAHYLDSNYTECINSIEFLIELDNFYVFEHDSGYDYNDIHLILLDSYVQSTLIDEAIELLDTYYPDFAVSSADSSWTIADSIYDNIDDALIHIVQLIKSDIWSGGFP
ncbi:hypothetical protein KJ762_10685 [bacterium]|nr:hypothetical protein [bacterium]